MGLVFGFIGAFLAALGFRKASSNTGTLSIGNKKPMTSMYNTESWRGVAKTLAKDIPVPFILKWIEIESGGNPCATGGALDRDGHTKEAGIFQFYYPDDYKRLGVSIDVIRACCEGGSYSKSQVCDRALTGSEINTQMQSGIDYINKARQTSEAQLASVGAKWGKSDKGYWKLVKLQHALPTIASMGIPLVTKILGRAPSSWNEFRSVVEQKLNVPEWIYAGYSIKGVKQYYSQAKIIQCLNNAERTGDAIG